jgi:hypothetical protein
VRHCNKKDVWSLVHSENTDEYHLYLLTAGLNTTSVVSRTGQIISGYENNGIGVLKFSEQRSKVDAVNAFDVKEVTLMNFDNTGGAINNPIVF